MAEEKDTSMFHVGLTDAQQTRKKLLESQKEIILALKRIDALRGIKEKKAAAALEMHKIMQEISLLHGKLRKSLPKTGIKAEPILKKKRDASKKEISHDDDRLKRLEHELDHIEGTLGDFMD